MPPDVILFYTIVLVIFAFVCGVKYCSFKVYEKLPWDIDGDCIELVDCFRKDCYFCNVDPTYPRS